MTIFSSNTVDYIQTLMLNIHVLLLKTMSRHLAWVTIASLYVNSKSTNAENRDRQTDRHRERHDQTSWMHIAGWRYNWATTRDTTLLVVR